MAMCGFKISIQVVALDTSDLASQKKVRKSRVNYHAHILSIRNHREYQVLQKLHRFGLFSYSVVDKPSLHC